MEGRIKEYLTTDTHYNYPYSNHYGYGSTMGCGDEFGCGRAYTFNEINENYNGSGIISYNDHKLYFINGYVLYITHIHNIWAIGKIIKNDLTTQDCYLGKVNNFIVVSDSVRGAFDELLKSITKTNDNENDIVDAFILAHPDYNKEYDWDEMVYWYSFIGSCANGRRGFSIDSNKQPGSKGTPKELIERMKFTRAIKLAEKMEKKYLEKNNK